MKYVLTFVALFAALPTVCSAEDLSAFGIPDVEVITDAEGENVRGLGIFSRSTSAAGISMNILDPNTGSQWNAFNTAFDTSDDSKTTGDVTEAPTSYGTGVQTSAFAAFADMDVTVTNTVAGVDTVFSFQTQGLGASSNGAAIGGSDSSFTFGPLTFPDPVFGGGL